jgi:hypothetical protein
MRRKNYAVRKAHVCYGHIAVTAMMAARDDTGSPAVSHRSRANCTAN